MTRPGYQLLGFIVWHGARWYLRRRFRRLVPSRRVVAAGAVGAGIIAFALADARRRS